MMHYCTTQSQLYHTVTTEFFGAGDSRLMITIKLPVLYHKQSCLQLITYPVIYNKVLLNCVFKKIILQHMFQQ